MAVRAWAMLGAAVIVMAGCGGDDSADDEGSATSIVEATQATEPPTSEPETSEPATTEAEGTQVDTTDADATDPPGTDSPQTSQPTSTESPDAAAGSACDVLVSLDPAALLGEEAGEPVGESGIFGDTCAIEPANPESHGALRLNIVTNSAADNFDKQRELFGVDSEIAGLGDQAFHSGPYVFVLDGETFVFIQLLRDSSLGLDVPDAELEAAAAAVLTAIA